MINHYKKVKFTVTLNILIFNCVTMFTLILINLMIDGNSLTEATISILISAAILLYIIKTKSYLIPSLLVIITGYVLNLHNTLKTTNLENVVEIFWIINLSIFAYFTLGKIIGHIYLIINVSTLFILTSLTKLHQVKFDSEVTNLTLNYFIELGSNLLICLVFFGYLITEFIEQNNAARKDTLKLNLELQKQYDEKSTMLKEIHHRVKNNLQIVISLLRLQLSKIKDKTATEPLQKSIDRITSIALIHEKMYQGDKVKAINITSYIKDLTDNLINIYANKTHINLHINSTVNTIELNHIVPLSLILNELISNSLKHAFENQKNGEIKINISTNQTINLNLCYKDNGKWKTPKNKNSFGLDLIDTFTEQLNGQYTFNSKKNAHYCFLFKDIIYKN